MSSAASAARPPTPAAAYERVKTNLRSMLATAKYDPVLLTIKLFSQNKLAPDVDTFELIADVLEASNNLDAASVYRRAAASERGSDLSEGDTEVEALRNLIANSQNDLDLVTSPDISVPEIGIPHVILGNIIVEIRIPLDVCPAVTVEGGAAEIVAQGEVPIPPQVGDKELIRLGLRAKKKAALLIQERLQELVAAAKENAAAEADIQSDVEMENVEASAASGTANGDSRTKVQILADLVSNAQGAHELLVSREHSHPVYRESSEHSRPGLLAIELKLHLDVSPELEIDLPQVVNTMATRAITPHLHMTARERRKKQLRNIAAGEALETLAALAAKVRSAAAGILTSDLEEKLNSWGPKSKPRRHVPALRRARSLVQDYQWCGLYGTRVLVYGSAASRTSLPNSDLDLSIVLPKFKEEEPSQTNTAQNWKDRRANSRLLSYISEAAHNAKMNHPFVVDSARVPVLRYCDPECKLDIDMTVCNDSGSLLTRLIRKHVSFDVRVWQLVMIVKFWSKQRDISGAPKSYINPLAWTVLVVYFLQHVVSPPIAGLFAVREGDKDHMARDAVIEKLRWNSSRKTGRNTMKIAELTVKFFRYYGYECDFDTQMISLGLTEPTKRIDVGENGPTRDTIFVEQPLIPGKNIVSYVGTLGMQETLREFRRALFTAENLGRTEILFESKSDD